MLKYLLLIFSILYAKPQLIITFPAHDHNLVFSYYNPDFNMFHTELKQVYEVIAYTTVTEDDIYGVMEHHSNADAFVICGHGVGNSRILLCNSNWGNVNYDSLLGERRYLGVEDVELGKYLPTNVTLFIAAYSAGSGGANTNNLVNFIYNLNTNNIVIGSQSPFGFNGVIITNMLPLRIKITSRIPSNIFLKYNKTDDAILSRFNNYPQLNVTYVRGIY